MLGDRKVRIKAVGDPTAMPNYQNMGTFSSVPSMSDLDSLSKLATSYVFEGDDRKAICRHNADVRASSARHEAACIDLVSHLGCISRWEG